MFDYIDRLEIFDKRQEEQFRTAPDVTCYSGNGISCLWNGFHPGQAIHRLVAGAVANVTGIGRGLHLWMLENNKLMIVYGFII